MLNQQLPEKAEATNGQHLAVNSIFYTIQGEGPFAGAPAVFVRLAGCNLQCPGCDTEYTERVSTPILDIAQMVNKHKDKTRLVVITGGEPFRQSIGPFVDHMLNLGYSVQIETNGTLFQELSFYNEDLVIICSPKTGQINAKLMPHIYALKYVGRRGRLSKEDGLPIIALEHPNHKGLARPPKEWGGEIYLQAEDQQDAMLNKYNLVAVTESCLEFGHKLCIQIHKLVGVP